AGGRFSRRSGLLKRPSDDALVGLVDVDAIGGGQFPIYRASAVRRSGPVRADLFFGFEELEFGLRLQNHGYRLVVPADVWLQSRHVLGRTGMNARQAAGVRTTSAWRRYYSVRNLIWISRTHGGPIAPLVATIRSGLFSAAADVWRGRSVRAAYPAVRGMMDAWRGRLGAVVVPEGYGENVLPEVGTAGVD
ncbi:MAG TPA: hypothetical protein PKV27_03355, partial [Ilumatobacteraceae bacterium]|nr:hypothetical protein [Ilumatobacteraceae bacterium]